MDFLKWRTYLRKTQAGEYPLKNPRTSEVLLSRACWKSPSFPQNLQSYWCSESFVAPLYGCVMVSLNESKLPLLLDVGHVYLPCLSCDFYPFFFSWNPICFSFSPSPLCFLLKNPQNFTSYCNACFPLLFIWQPTLVEYFTSFFLLCAWIWEAYICAAYLEIFQGCSPSLIW